jgi:DNA-binding NarL/FixJ family response regulator
MVKVKLQIVDDHKVVRDGLRLLFEQQPDMEVIAEADNGRTALQLARKLKPDVIVMDISMPKLNGYDAALQISKELPQIKLIALSMHTDARHVEAMLSAKVSGYVIKNCAFEELVHAVCCAMQGRVYLSPSIADIVVKGYLAQNDNNRKPKHTLTGREREILQLISEGTKTKDIAAQLFISVKTVDTHRRQIMQKLKLSSVAELTKFAVREGITLLD